MSQTRALMLSFAEPPGWGFLQTIGIYKNENIDLFGHLRPNGWNRHLPLLLLASEDLSGFTRRIYQVQKTFSLRRLVSGCFGCGLGKLVAVLIRRFKFALNLTAYLIHISISTYLDYLHNTRTLNSKQWQLVYYLKKTLKVLITKRTHCPFSLYGATGESWRRCARAKVAIDIPQIRCRFIAWFRTALITYRCVLISFAAVI